MFKNFRASQMHEIQRRPGSYSARSTRRTLYDSVPGTRSALPYIAHIPARRKRTACAGGAAPLPRSCRGSRNSHITQPRAMAASLCVAPLKGEASRHRSENWTGTVSSSGAAMPIGGAGSAGSAGGPGIAFGLCDLGAVPSSARGDYRRSRPRGASSGRRPNATCPSDRPSALLRLRTRWR